MTDETITNNNDGFKEDDKNLAETFKEEEKFEDMDDENYDESIYDLADLINDMPGMEVMGAGLEDGSPYLYFKCDNDEGIPLLILSSALWITIFPDEEFERLVFSVEMPENEEEREKYISQAYDEITGIIDDEDDMEGNDKFSEDFK